MTDEKIKKATHMGVLKIGDSEIPCAVLEDGTRVLSERGFTKALGGKRGGAHWRRKRKSGDGAFLPVYVSANNLIPYIDNDLATALAVPIKYSGPKGGIANGIPAQYVQNVCEVYLEARDADDLYDSQLPLAEQAEKLVRGLATVGIIALVDEATGYQDDRVKDALEKILSVYLLKEKKPYIGMFPLWFYKEIYRLNGWRWSPENAQKRPGVIGRWTNELVWAKLAPKLLQELQKRNPPIKPGRRAYKHFQFLTDDVGDPALKAHFEGLGALMRASTQWRKFRALAEKAYPDPNKTLELEIGYREKEED